MNDWSVYIHTTPDGKVYVGATSKPPRVRWNYGYGYRCSPFYKIIKQFGWNNISHKVVATGLNEQEAFDLEKKLISEYDSTNPDKGYNCATGGRGTWGVKISDETRQRLVDSHLGKENPHSDEWNQKISDSIRGKKKPHVGVPRSEKARAKMAGKKPVIQYTLDGKEVARYETVTDAAKAVSRSVSTIGKCCNGFARTACGYIWKFENDVLGGKTNGAMDV